MEQKTDLTREGTDASTPGGEYRNANVNESERTASSIATSSISRFEKRVVIRNIEIKNLVLPYNAEREARRLANILANKGPEPSSSEDIAK